MRCDWYAWFVSNENQADVSGNGNWCETRWWLWLLIFIGGLLLLAMLIGVICACCCRKKTKEREPLVEPTPSPPRPQRHDVVVERNPYRGETRNVNEYKTYYEGDRVLVETRTYSPGRER